MNPEPVAPGQSPIPVVIIDPAAHASSVELWIVGTNIALTTVTLAVVLLEIHKDHEAIKALLTLIARLLPPYRRGTGQDEPDDQADTDTVPTGSDAAGNVPL